MNSAINKDMMVRLFKKFLLLNLGFFFCALGTVFFIKSGSGMSPWEVLHSGIASTFDIRIGRAGIIVSGIIVALDCLLGAKIGIGTVLNMLFIGLFTDMILSLEIINTSSIYMVQIAFLFIGMFAMNIGIWIYISQGLGAGPRDGLMVAVSKRSGISVQTVRSSIETAAVIIGIMLGGSFGFGTIICAILAGPFMKIIFDRIGFDVKGVSHTYIDDYFIKKRTLGTDADEA